MSGPEVPEPRFTIPERDEGHVSWLLYGGGAFLVVVALLGLSGWALNVGDADPVPVQPDPYALLAGATRTSTHLVVENREVGDWTRPVVIVNGDYRYTFERIRARQESRVELGELSTRNGLRFDPYARKVVSVCVQVGERMWCGE